MVKKIKVRLEDLVEEKKFLSDSLIIRVSDNEIVTIKKDLNFRRVGVSTYSIDHVNEENCEIYNKSFRSVYSDDDEYKLYKRKLMEKGLW